MTWSSVIVMNPWDSQGNQITDARGVCHTIRGCGGAGYQQGYIFAIREEGDPTVGCMDDRRKNGADLRVV